MGRDKNHLYRKSLHQQAHERLVGMQAFGDSKYHDKLTGADRYKIYAFSTYNTYRRIVMQFIRYIETEHPECTTLRQAKRFANEWLQIRVDAGLSAWTISTDISALSKLYGILPDDPNRFRAPVRRRMDIKRSRVPVERDNHFSLTNNAELIEFVCGTGARRSALERLRGDDLWPRERMTKMKDILMERDVLTDKEAILLNTLREGLETFPDIQFFAHFRKDKGGRSRFAPILPSHQELVVRRMREVATDAPVFMHVHRAADIHSYRGRYAKSIYRRYCRPIEQIPYDRIRKGSNRPYQSDVYVCRGDERGRKLDRAALNKVSRSLGHTRTSVVASHYIYGL